MALDAHCNAVSACRRCHGLPAEASPVVSAARAPDAMLIGQAPGQVEAGGGRPFAGRAGRTLFRWLESAGLSEAAARERIYIAAITRCYPGPHPSGRGDRVPSPEERENCRPWLDAELRLLRPPILIPVGRLAVDQFIGKRPLDAVVGRVLQVEHAGGESRAIALPHPSGASGWLNAPGHRELLSRALELLRVEFAAEHGRSASRVRAA